MATAPATNVRTKILRRLSRGRRWYPTLIVEAGVGEGLRISLRNASADYSVGTNELPVQLAVRDHTGAGGVFYDIGSNVGFFALVAARLVGPGGAVYAFEPVPDNVECIRANAARNRFANVTVLPVAVGAAEGKAQLRLAEHPGGASLAAVGGEQRAVLEVPVVPVDALVASGQVRPPTFVKVDVEGTEPDVLTGMLATLGAHRPALLVEVDAATADEADSRAGSVRQIVAPLGYRLERLPPSYPGTDWHVVHLLGVP